MEFWGVEVKAGEPFKVVLDEGRALHLSQACIGEVKKDKGQESVCLFVNSSGKKLVLGTLFFKKLPQQIFDLVFDKEVELSHNWKNGSVFFYGYTADNPSNQSSSEEDSEPESDEDIPLLVPNGGPTTQVKQEKPAEAQKVNAGKDSAAGKQKVKIVEPNKDATSEDDDDSSDEDDAMSEDDSEDEEDKKIESDEEDDDSDEDEETPVQVKSSKKRALESDSKTPVPNKKAKSVTPQKTDGKKSSVHVATPHPSKQIGKTPANKSNLQTPKTEESHSCKPCKRKFKSEAALDSHNNAKHGSGK